MNNTEYFACSGGGTKGIIFSGILDALDDHMDKLGCNYDEWRRNLKGLAGTSAGTFCCLSIILGLDKFQRNKAIRESFSDIRNIIPCPDISLMVTSYGLENGKTFKEQIKKILLDSGLNQETTLGGIKRLFGKEFVCVCSDLQSQTCVYLSSTNTPGIKVYDAIYMSCSIPFVFAPMEYNDRYMIDGSLTQDIPFVFDDAKTLFLFIPKCQNEKKIASWFDYIQCLLNFPVVFQNNKEKLNDKICICINENESIKNLPAFDINLSETISNELVSYGYMIVMNIITNNKPSITMGMIVTIFLKVIQTEDVYEVC